MENGNGLTKADLKAALAELRNEIKADLVAQEDSLMEKMCQIETNLLTEFHRLG